MERRLLKDFQIGLVEGLVKDAIASDEKGPKDVFSKIAKAIGRRTSQGSRKKDWNAVARQKSLARDPIGSTAEGAERRHRQSVRRYILDHQKDSLLSMDADKLIEYNPLLAEIAPAARVAYAKFKIPKIKQEYEENTVGVDDVFENAPTVDVVDETAARAASKSSIARPRPKSARQSPVAGALPYPSADKDGGTPKAPAKKLEKTKTPDPKTVAKGCADKTPATARKEEPVAAQPPKPETAESSEPSTSGAKGPEVDGGKPDEVGGGTTGPVEKDGDGATKDADEPKDGDKEKDVDKEKDKDKDKTKEKAGQHLLKPESPKRPAASPKKAGGKSKVTGEILTGWL